MPGAVTTFFDTSETREAALTAASLGIVAAAQGVAPAKLPVTRKSELIDLQRRNPLFGGLTAAAPCAVARVFASLGPIYEIEAPRPDFVRMAHAAGFRAGGLVHNALSHHPTPAGAMLGRR